MHKRVMSFSIVIIVIITLIILGFLFIKTLDKSFNTKVTFKDTITRQEVDATFLTTFSQAYNNFVQSEYPILGTAKLNEDIDANEVYTVNRYLACTSKKQEDNQNPYAIYDFEIRPDHEKYKYIDQGSVQNSYRIYAGENYLVPILISKGSSITVGKMKSDEFWIYNLKEREVSCPAFNSGKCYEDVLCSSLVLNGKKPLKIIKII